MNDDQEHIQSKPAKWGWGIQLVISALLVLNGVSWFFIGPNNSSSYQAQELGISAAEYHQNYPNAASGVERNARQVAIWFVAYGSMALLVFLQGYRYGLRWAWIAGWIQVAVLVAIGILYLAGIGIVLLPLAVIGLVGQILIRTGRREPPMNGIKSLEN
jgi:hypothetical protein